MKAILKVNKKSPYFDKNVLTLRLTNLRNVGGDLVFFYGDFDQELNVWFTFKHFDICDIQFQIYTTDRCLTKWPESESWQLQTEYLKSYCRFKNLDYFKIIGKAKAERDYKFFNKIK